MVLMEERSALFIFETCATQLTSFSTGDEDGTEISGASERKGEGSLFDFLAMSTCETHGNQQSILARSLPLRRVEVQNNNEVRLVS